MELTPIDAIAEPILMRIATLARGMPAATFLDLMYEVAAEMAGKGTPIGELASIYDRFCTRARRLRRYGFMGWGAAPR